MNGLLNEAVNKFDDIRIALKQFREWEDHSPIWGAQCQGWINDYQTALKDANLAMSQAISDLDASGGLDQFDKAFKMYGENEKNIPHRYMLELESSNINEKNHTPGSVHRCCFSLCPLGSVNCSLPSPEPLFVGYAATSSTGFGNGGNIECLTSDKPDLEQKGSRVHSGLHDQRIEVPASR
ncbi:uncharacterized protein CEXT_508481 [Caerostris extrusa]|uniref:Uncharacterized protein n=1 Tax=Caerostris extrusa TaxID=172846 RepID=A0AAV4WIT1_CAEEX|nr:uncharacterized protein CEXT_508481 [Caerostris extrusa]